MKLLKAIKHLLNNKDSKSLKVENNSSVISDKIRTHLQKYKETYRLLGEYDKKSLKDPEILANPGRLRDPIRKLQANFSDR